MSNDESKHAMLRAPVIRAKEYLNPTTATHWVSYAVLLVSTVAPALPWSKELVTLAALIFALMNLPMLLGAFGEALFHYDDHTPPFDGDDARQLPGDDRPLLLIAVTLFYLFVMMGYVDPETTSRFVEDMGVH